ncbi:hypothetical protein C0989_001214 [Termitomyces sp. Mn162]|nr:hypothetical protein C0989_001759 [Termitomyces sp. Mn162]KAG5345905.1 hypothetical protein C0989_001214 [Termitomyces sp. Mn162]
MSARTGATSPGPPDKLAVPPPTITPALAQSPDRSGTRMKSKSDPAASPGEPHSSALPRPTFPPPQQP